MMLVPVLLFIWYSSTDQMTYPFATMEACEAAEVKFQNAGYQDKYVFCWETGFEMKAQRP